MRARLLFPALLALAVPALLPAAPSKIAWSTDYPAAIRSVQKNGKLLLIRYVWKKHGTDPVCDHAQKLLDGLGDVPDLGPVVAEHFVCVEVGCETPDDLFMPKGPEGPFRFQYRALPEILIKDASGATQGEQSGVTDEDAVALEQIRQLVLEAVKHHGPVLSPDLEKRLKKDLAEARKRMDKGIYDHAGELLAELRKATESFQGEEVPRAVTDVRESLAWFQHLADMAMEEAKGLEDGGDAAKAAKRYAQIARDFAALPETAKAAKEAAVRLKPPEKTP